jgi:competence protein ComEC
MAGEITEFFKRHKNKIFILGAALAVLDVLIWLQILGIAAAGENLEMYFLDVGQGDSGFVELPGLEEPPFGDGVQVLVDGGPPNGRVLEELGRILERGDRYIDLVILSHPELDHFGGLVEILKRYRVGVFISNGLKGKSVAFQDFENAIRESGVREVVLRAGDKITYAGNEFKVLSPDAKALTAKDLNDTSLVLELRSKNSRILFTGDISSAVENLLPVGDIDILKVAHHGSRFSSSANFLSAVKPEAAVIEVGKNSYGHPTSQTLSGLEEVGAKILRTDSDGTIRFEVDGENIRIFKTGGIE